MDWREKGATVIPFDSPTGLFLNKFPVDTVINVAKLWAWTGEFVAACARMGKMPTLYKSYGLPGGYERAKKYEGTRFHDDLSIQPIAAGVLEKEYLLTKSSGCWRGFRRRKVALRWAALPSGGPAQNPPKPW